MLASKHNGLSAVQTEQAGDKKGVLQYYFKFTTPVCACKQAHQLKHSRRYWKFFEFLIK